MGSHNSKQDFGKKREFSQQSINTELDNSSSSIYSNYEVLRNETQSDCMACSYKSQWYDIFKKLHKYMTSKPNWLKFYHAKCDKMMKNNIPWAQEGKVISEMKGKKDYRGEYDTVFQDNMKKIKKIVSNRPSMKGSSGKYQNQNMHNLLGDLNQIANPSQQNKKGIYKSKGDQQKIDSSYSHKRSDKQFSSSHFTSNNDNDFYSVKSELLSNPTPLNHNIAENDRFKKSGRIEDHSHYMSCKSNNQKTDDPYNSEFMNNQNYNNQNNQNAQNNSFPSYMLENEFQGLRAGNTIVMKNDPESQRKNLEFYFECTSLISQHLDDPNFTLYSIRQIFIISFYTRYSQQIKIHREQLAQKKNEQNITKQQATQNTSSNESNNNQLQKEKIDVLQSNYQQNQGQQHNPNNYCQRFCSTERFSPLQDALSIYKNAIREFQYFTKIYMEIIKQYYDIHYKKNIHMNDGLKELFSYKNFQNFVITKLFQNEKIPKILIELIKLVIPNDKDLINQIDRHKLTPQMFGIPNHLSLDEETRKFLGCTPHYTSQEGFGSIKEEFEDFEFIHQSNSNYQKQNPKQQYLDEHLNNQRNNQQTNKIQNGQNQQIHPTDQNAINSDQYSPKTSSYTESIESYPTSKFNSHQKFQISQRNIQQEDRGKHDEEDNEIGVSEEDQDIIFELKITNQAKSQFTQLYQQNDQLRGNSNIFHSELSSQIKQEINIDGQQTHLKIQNPYQKCIDFIEQMINSTTPTGKFKAIILACESIEKCIKEFYKQNGRTFNQTLEQESIISILTFVIAQTGFNNLEAHYKFVHSFYKNPSKRMKLKYYLIAFEISVRNMQELYCNLTHQQKQLQQQSISNSQQIETAHDTSFSSNKSAQSIFKKNLNKKLVEAFGNDNSQTHQLMNITGKNSFLKQTLAETKF